MPFALISYTRIEDPHAAQVNLDNSILPRVKLHLEGLLKAYFTVDDSYSNGMSVLVFATRDQAEAMAAPGHAIELKFVLQFLDALSEARQDVLDHMKRLGATIPAEGLVPVAGGLADEMMRPLDFAPLPDRPVRAAFAPEVVRAELDRLASQQEDDGGWRPDFAAASPMAALEWRGYQTVWAISTLRANGRL